MFGLILGILFSFIGFISFVWLIIVLNKTVGKSSKGFKKDSLPKAKVFVLLVVSLFSLVGLSIGFNTFAVLDATEVAVVTKFGELQGTVSSAGFHSKNMFAKYHKYSLKIQEIKYDSAAGAGVSFYSKDSQPVDAMLTVQWKIKGEEAQNIYLNFGNDVENVRARLGSLVIERTKSTLSTFTAEQLISQRTQLSPAIEELISKEITARGTPVTIVAVYLTDFAFSPAFEAAVEAKMIAEQDKLKAETEKQIGIIKAEQALAITKLEAESALAKAKGDADAIVAIATAEATALSMKLIDVARTMGFAINENPVLDEEGKEISKTYSIDTTGHSAEEIEVIFNYVKYIAYLQTWDGKLPTVITDGSGIIVQP